MIHLTPIWFDWDGSVFRLTLGAGRVHLKNLAADPRITILIDQDPRLEQGLAAGAWAIEARGTAELSKDDELIREVTGRVLVKALGPDADAVRRADHGRGPHDRHDHAHAVAHLGLQQGRRVAEATHVRRHPFVRLWKAALSIVSRDRYDPSTAAPAA